MTKKKLGPDSYPKSESPGKSDDSPEGHQTIPYDEVFLTEEVTLEENYETGEPRDVTDADDLTGDFYEIEQFNNNVGIYLAGHTYGHDDQLPRFMEEGIWETGFNRKYAAKINEVKAGALLLSKTKSIRGSILIIDGIGIVESNDNNGTSLKVRWIEAQEVSTDKEIRFPKIAGTYPGTFHKLKSSHIVQVVSTIGLELFQRLIRDFDASMQYAGLRIRADSPEVYLNAEIIAREFASIIHRSKSATDTTKPSQEDRFYGIFGQWGRGKTRFWNLVRESLKSNEGQYRFIDFHAWKYQDTPAVWAYLYEKFADEYYFKARNIFFYPFQVIINGLQSFWLSVYRSPGHVYAFLGSVILLVLVLTIGKTNIIQNGKVESWPSVLMLIGSVGLSIYTFLQTFSKPIASSAKQFIKLASRKSFKVHLGIQHEAQEELKILLKAWYRLYSKNKKKTLVLFIDDIDRCDEKKVVQIVDSIRVMLNEPEIQRRLIVLAAIDERILCQAIRKKYEGFVDNKHQTLDVGRLTSEYLDKLFIAGVKLSELNNQNKQEILKGYAKDMIECINRKKLISQTEKQEKSHEDEGDKETEIGTALWVRQTITKVLTRSDTVGDEKVELSITEGDMLAVEVQGLKYATPRSIRGFLVKYRLARNLAAILLGTKPDQRTFKDIAQRIVSVMNFEPHHDPAEPAVLDDSDRLKLEAIIDMVDYYHGDNSAHTS